MLVLFLFRGSGKEKAGDSKKHRCERDIAIGCLSTCGAGIEPATQVRALDWELNPPLWSEGPHSSRQGHCEEPVPALPGTRDPKRLREARPGPLGWLFAAMPQSCFQVCGPPAAPGQARPPFASQAGGSECTVPPLQICPSSPQGAPRAPTTLFPFLRSTRPPQGFRGACPEAPRCLPGPVRPLRSVRAEVSRVALPLSGAPGQRGPARPCQAPAH